MALFLCEKKMSKKLLAHALCAYIGTKSVLATTMTRGEYNEYRGWQIPENEDPSEQGYLVEYVDGGKPNDERHTGYISWSPRDVFEKSYHQSQTPQELQEKAVAPRVTKDQIDALMDRVVVHTTTCMTPVPHVLAIAWLDDKFYLGTAISKSVNPENFNEEIGIQYSTKDVLEIAENKLWELEGYRLFASV